MDLAAHSAAERSGVSHCSLTSYAEPPPMAMLIGTQASFAAVGVGELSGTDTPEQEHGTGLVMANEVVAPLDGPIQPALSREDFMAGKAPFSVTFALWKG